MTVAKKEIQIAVIVVIEEFESPSAHHARSRTNSGRKRQVAECLVLVVVIERVNRVIRVGHEQINPTFLIVISRIHSHPGAWFAKNLPPHPCQQSYFFK